MEADNGRTPFDVHRCVYLIFVAFDCEEHVGLFGSAIASELIQPCDYVGVFTSGKRHLRLRAIKWYLSGWAHY